MKFRFLCAGDFWERDEEDGGGTRTREKGDS